MTTTFSPADQGGNTGGSQGATFGDQDSGDNLSAGDEGANNLTTEQVADIVKRDTHAQQHIKNLEAETQTYREELEVLRKKADAALTADEILEKISARDNDKSDIDVEALVERVTRSTTDALELKDTQRVQTENFKEVSASVQSKFGKDADVEMAKVASENGMTFEDIIQMAHTNPNLVLKLCNVTKEVAPVPAQGSVLTSQFTEAPAPAKVNVMELRTTSALVADYNRRMDEFLKSNQA